MATIAGARRIIIDTATMGDKIEVSISYYLVNKLEYEITKAMIEALEKKIKEEYHELKSKAEFDDDSNRVTITTEASNYQEFLRILAQALAFTFLLSPDVQLHFITELVQWCSAVRAILSQLMSGETYDSSGDNESTKDAKTK